MSGQIIGPIGVLPVGGGVPTFTPTDNPAHQAAGFASPVTFSGVNTGTGLVVLTVQMVNTGSLTGITLNGSSMTLAVSSTPASNRTAQIWYLAGQSANASSTIVLTGGAMDTVAIQTSVLANLSSSTPGTPATVTYANLSTPFSVGPIIIPTNGFGIASVWMDGTNTLSAGTNVIIDYQTDDMTTLDSILAHMAVSGSQSLVLTGPSFQGFAAAFIPWS